MIVDTHCHLDFEWFDDDREQVIERAGAAGVSNIIVPALDLANSRTVLELAGQYESVFGAVGVHPNSSANWEDNWIDAISDLAQQPKCVAIGEIGLDYYRDSSPKLVQQTALEAQLHLAWKRNLPVIIHNRDSDHDLINLLKASPIAGRDHPGVLHSFLTSWEIAEQALDLGFYIGFTGPITYKNSDSLRQVIKKVPLDRILVETDAPFLTPQAKRGQRNEPAYVAFIVEELARIKQRPVEEIAAITTGNATALFGPTIGLVE
ncbi:MAG: TatD family hydrolase [Anaerolineae bacterium]|nr:MAG: TatD family hydrolase [Anaerolineae bacterium]